MNRRGIASAIMILLAMLVIEGVFWIGVYYGAIQGIQNTLTAEFGGGIYDTATLTFIDTVCSFWVFIMTLGGLMWLWQRSQKP